MKHFYIFLYLFLLGFSQVLTSQNRAKVISSHGYDNCIELTNQWVRVVLEPNLGGRVLVYEKNGRNVLYVDTLQNGFVNTKKTANIQPAAGRFDIGPESVQKKRLALWTGKYSFKILSNSKVMLQSPADSVSGFQITRIFELGYASSLLRCQQIVKNISNKTQMACHWGRTFALGGGIALSPQNPMSRFPKGYCIYRPPNKTIDFSPTPEPNVRERENVLEILGKPSNSKFVMDPSEGWLAYLSTNNLLFVKKFAIYGQKAYAEVTAASASIWYNENIMCEIEPIGPQEFLKPNQTFSFTEDWFLEDYTFPEDRKADLKQIKNIINACK